MDPLGIDHLSLGIVTPGYQHRDDDEDYPKLVCRQKAADQVAMAKAIRDLSTPVNIVDKRLFNRQYWH